ncbi:Ig heavy chain Mem5 [Colossoma macropomum]|uniref:Ig heavy chain Mem5 n=1 Tax=Colossoma macropomum TaxID=42526 RepID=UPI001864B291|nr:Ig heavy chain Mem5 [Colossoma macropomum]
MQVLLLLALASAVAKTVLSGRVIQFPSLVQVRSGDPVRMSCRLDGVKAYCYTVAWMRVNPDTGMLVINKDAVGPLWNKNHSQDTECPVVIQNATAEDSGTYYCAVTDRQKIYIGNGSVVLVQAHSSAAPSVEVLRFSSSSSCGSAVPVQCVVKGVVPSQVEVYWTIGDRRERGQTETVRAKGEVYTVSRTLLRSEECERGDECACVVEHEGQSVTKTLEPNGLQESCYAAVGLHRALALTTSLLLFITAVTAVSTCSTTQENIK